MKKQLKLGGNEIEITISAQSYLDFQKINPVTGQDWDRFHESLVKAVEDRLYSVSATFNRFPLITIPGVPSVALHGVVEHLESLSSVYLKAAHEPSAIEDAVLENQLHEKGYKP